MGMPHNVLPYILVMAGVTYLIRMLPLALWKKEIKNKYVRSFLYYVPYACLAAMTFPAILSATGSTVSALCGWRGRGGRLKKFKQIFTVLPCQ